MIFDEKKRMRRDQGDRGMKWDSMKCDEIFEILKNEKGMN